MSHEKREDYTMAKKQNLSDQLNESSSDEEKLCGANFIIHKNVMIWNGTILQLSNISSIAQYNAWEHKEEEYSEKMEKLVSFKELREKNPVLQFAFWAAIACFVISMFSRGFLIPAIGLAVLVGYYYYKQRKTTIDVPKTRTDRICHYMICITMNSNRKYDFELKTETFRNDVMVALYHRIVGSGNEEKNIQFDLNNCNIFPNSVITGEEVLIGNNNTNNIGSTEEFEDNEE